MSCKSKWVLANLASFFFIFPNRSCTFCEGNLCFWENLWKNLSSFFMPFSSNLGAETGNSSRSSLLVLNNCLILFSIFCNEIWIAEDMWAVLFFCFWMFCYTFNRHHFLGEIGVQIMLHKCFWKIAVIFFLCVKLNAGK